MYKMPLIKEKVCTIDDIYLLPEGKRAELIDGQLYDMAPPNRRHQMLVSELHYQIKDYIRRKGGSCEVYPAPFAVKLNADDKTYVEPDISVICNPAKLTEEGCTGAPDWIIEVVSPASKRMDYSIKLFKYRTAGVREYWILDADKNRIIVYDLDNDDMDDFSFSDVVKSRIYDDLMIDFSKIKI